MARKPQTSSSTALTDWSEELARQAELAAGMEAGAGGSFFSTRGGQLSYNDMPLPDNRMAVIIVDAILENVMYEGRFDPENPTPPTCFAFGRDENTMAPHPDVVAAGHAQHEQCRGCPMNEWGSAETGRGKACRNTRRLALVPAGDLDNNGHLGEMTNAEDLQTSQIGFLKLPVTSIKGYATFVKSVAGALKRPPHGIVTKVEVVPDPKTQFRVVFSPLKPLPNDLIGIVMQRREEVSKMIEQPYSLEPPEEPAPKGRGAAKGGRRPPVKRGGKY